MSPIVRAYCWLINRLNFIPRYGRLYTLHDGTKKIELKDQKPEWKWQRYGMWGVNILDNQGLLMRYSNYREEKEYGIADCGVEHPHLDHQYCVLPVGHYPGTLHEDTEGNTWKGMPDE